MAILSEEKRKELLKKRDKNIKSKNKVITKEMAQNKKDSVNIETVMEK